MQTPSNASSSNSTTRTKPFGPIKQLGYLVEDIDSAVNAWMEQLGVGPWTVMKNVTLEANYLGEKTTTVMDVALAYDAEGDKQIELIQQTNDAPSPYIAFFREKRFGMHHIAYFVDDISQAEQDALKQGLELIFDIRQPDGSRYLYFQHPGLGNEVFIEFIENTEMMQGMYQAGIDATRSWDGNLDVTTIDLASL